MLKRSPLVPAADIPDLPVAMNSELSTSVLAGSFTSFLPISFTLGKKNAFWIPLMRPLHLLTYFYYLLIAGLLLTPVARADIAIGSHGDGVEAPAILQPVLVSLANKISPDGSSPTFNATFSPATGLITGSFKLPTTPAATASFSALAVGDKAMGHYIAPTPAGVPEKRYGHFLLKAPAIPAAAP